MFEVDFYTQDEDAIIKMANEKLQASNEDWERQIWQFIADWYNSDIQTIQIFTSGSTGTPKQIEHTKDAMIHSAELTCKALNLKPGNTALLCLPVNKISGMMMVVRCIRNKMRMNCIRPSANPLQDLPENAGIDFAAFTPMQFHTIAGSYPDFVKADTIGKVILGGENVRAELLHNIQKLKSAVYITFGMTETISHIALKRLNGTAPDKNFKVLPGITISVDDKNCLIIKAPLLGQPHLLTHDVVNITSANEFKWLGRIDNVINSGGVKIYPEEIEQQLAGVIEAPYFITSKPDERTGRKLVLVLEMSVLKAGEKEELKDTFSKLEKPHRPKEVLLVPKFTRTTNGKIKRAESTANVLQVIDFAGTKN